MSGKGSDEPSGYRQATVGIHAGLPEPVPGAPVVLPVVQSATFFGGAGELASELVYSRYGNNPNQALVGEKMAALESTEAALLLSSGMSAIAMTLLAALPEGGHIVASRHLYGATRTLLEHELPRRGITTTLIDPESREDWEGALTPETGVLLLEVPANPTLRVFDLRVPAEIARDRDILLAVDGTFASPVNIRFAELGVGAVVHSATKYLGGHSDLVAGVVSGSQELIERVQNMMKLYGPAPDPHMAWLLDRGLKTLQMASARAQPQCYGTGALVPRSRRRRRRALSRTTRTSGPCSGIGNHVGVRWYARGRTRGRRCRSRCLYIHPGVGSRGAQSRRG